MNANKSGNLIRGVLIGTICGLVVGALATTLGGQAVLTLIFKVINKLKHRPEGVDLRYLLQ